MEATSTVSLSTETINEIAEAVAARFETMTVSVRTTGTVEATGMAWPGIVHVGSVGPVGSGALLVLAVLGLAAGGLYIGGWCRKWTGRPQR